MLASRRQPRCTNRAGHSARGAGTDKAGAAANVSKLNEQFWPYLEPAWAYLRQIRANLGQFRANLPVLGQLGDWLRFANLQDTHFGEVKNLRKTIVFSFSEAFQAPKLFDRGSDGPNLGPPNFSKEKYKGPMAPVVKKNRKITKTSSHPQQLITDGPPPCQTHGTLDLAGRGILRLQ